MLKTIQFGRVIMNIIVFLLQTDSFFLNNPLLLLSDYLLFRLFTGAFAHLIILYTAILYRIHGNTRLAITFSSAAIGMFLMLTLVGTTGDYLGTHKIIYFKAIFFFVFIFVFWEVFGYKPSDSVQTKYSF